MKKFIVYLSSFALAGSVAYAMNEAVDEEMMMEAPAPSVSLTGEAELGFKNVDKDSEPDAESMHLIRKYQVNFSSQGTTDGGLVFGAGISIEDEHEGNANKVNGSNVYIGGADGSWKLKLGGNDPGIEQAGGIGVADGHFDGGDSADIGLEGAFGATSYRLTVADPQAKNNSSGDGDWSLGASHSSGDINVGFGMDSEKGIALALGSTFSGVGVDVYYSQSEESTPSLMSGARGFDRNPDPDKDDKGGVFAQARTTPAAGDTAAVKREFVAAADVLLDNYNLGAIENKGIGAKVSMSAGEGASFSVAYSTYKTDQNTAASGWIDGADALATGDQVAANAITATMESEAKEIEIGFTYDLGGGASFNASITKTDTEDTYTLKPATSAAESTFNTASNGTDDEPQSIMKSDDTTTLEATLAFTF